jgi:hypothetical protein
MSPLDRLRWAIAPDPRRGLTLILGSLAVFSLLGGVSFLLPPPRALAGAMVLLMLLAWFVGLCGMVGYLRWYFTSGSSGSP